MRTLAALCLLATAAAADEVELTSGTVVEGKVEDLGESIRVTRSGGSAVYPKSMVRRITPKKTNEDLYAEKSAALKPGDVAGRLALARWCLERKLAAEAAAEFKKVIAVDPDHEEARLGTGYRKHEGAWLAEDDYHQARGFVKHKGRWITPEQRDLETAVEEQKELERAVAEKVRLLLDRMRSSDPKRREEAAAGLAGVEDRYKAKAYAAAVTSSSEHVRAHVYPELGRMKEAEAVKPLVRKSLWDDVEALRGVAFQALRDIGHPDTAVHYVPFLGEESVSARIRCAESIAFFKDPRVVPALLAALENSLATEQAVEQYGADMTVMTNWTMVMRDGRRVTLPALVRIRPDFTDRGLVARLDQEQAALASTLAAITGESHGEDVARWRAWLASRKSQPPKQP